MKMGLSLLIVASSLAAGCAAPSGSAPKATAAAAAPRTIERAEIEVAQRAWCDGLIAIGRTHKEGGDAKAKAGEVIDAAYNYENDKVLFKPTLTFGEKTFRLDRRGALAYFVGGDPDYPDDKGFALKEWTACEPKVVGMVTHGEMAITTGNVHLTSTNGDKVMVDKTFGYVRDDAGTPRIALHHSSLPFDPSKK